MRLVQKPSVVIADDHTLVAEACKRLLEPEFDVVGVVDNGRDLLRRACESTPDVVVLDIAMPQMNGLEAAERLRELLPNTKIVFLTMNTAPDVAAEAFRCGACGYVVKSSSAEDLATAIRRALRSELYLSPTITKETVDFLLQSRDPRSPQLCLSARQNEVLQLLADGMSMKEIAAQLDLKLGTVGYHKYRIMKILGLRNNAELLQYAIKHRLIA